MALSECFPPIQPAGFGISFTDGGHGDETIAGSFRRQLDDAGFGQRHCFGGY
jgi:hypothetical protein